MIEILGAPFDLCGMRLGSRLGPAAIRLAGLHETLSALGLAHRDSGDIEVSLEPHTDGGLRNFSPLRSAVAALRRGVEQSLAAGHLPVVLGGEHTLSAGSVSAALNAFGDELAVLWIDAHADINTPGRSLTGNIHGMPLAALAGFESGVSGPADDDWRELLSTVGPQRLKLERIAWYGLRDVDDAEREFTGPSAQTMPHVDRYGVDRTVQRFDEWMRSQPVRRLWISFDVDALDPFLAPGTGTAVRGGLTYREAHLVAELLREHLDRPDCPYELVGVDLVETNPLYDHRNETAVMAVEWLASLFGKTVLGVRS